MEQVQHTYLHKAVIRGEVVSHRIPPALVVSFEEWEESADLLEDLERKQKCQYGSLKEEDAPLHCLSVWVYYGASRCYINTHNVYEIKKQDVDNYP